jgi:hypothetical protein
LVQIRPLEAEISQDSILDSIGFEPIRALWAGYRESYGRRLPHWFYSERLNGLFVNPFSGLAVDWVAGNLYWTDPKLNVIEVSRLDGRFRYVVISGGVDSPHSLALDPPKGLLFWSDSGKKFAINRANLDGSGRFTILGDSLGNVHDIALDTDVSTISWTQFGLP